MPRLSLSKLAGAILAHAKSLVSGGEGAQRGRLQEPSLASGSHAGEASPGLEWGFVAPDKAFWATVAGADRRLAELRRAIDHVAADETQHETVDQASPDLESHLGESRCEAANRVIAAALDAEKS